MDFSLARRFVLVAAFALTFTWAVAPVHAEDGTVHIKIVKGGWVIGAQAGDGTLTFRRKTYRLSIGGLSAGLVFGGSATEFIGTAKNLRSPADIVGTYSALGAGVALAAGARAIQMRNAKGVELTLRGRQVGLMANLDLSGMSISLR